MMNSFEKVQPTETGFFKEISRYETKTAEINDVNMVWYGMVWYLSIYLSIYERNLIFFIRNVKIWKSYYLK